MGKERLTMHTIESRVMELELTTATMENDLKHIRNSVENIPKILETITDMKVAQSKSEGSDRTVRTIVSILAPVVMGAVATLASVFMFLNH